MNQFYFLGKVAVLVLLVCCLGGCERKTKEQLLREGIELRTGSNPTGSIVLFKNALEKDPNFFEARMQLGLAYMAGGNYGQAEKELAKVLLQDPRNGEVLLHLATVHLGDHAADKAVTYTERYIREQAPSALAFELLGKGHALKGDSARADQAFRKALELDSRQTGARNGLARLSAISGDLEAARKLLNENLELDPRNLESYYLILQLEGAAGNLEKAILTGKRLLELFPAEIRAVYLLGMLHLQHGDPASAGQLASDFLARSPDHPVGVRLRGLVQYAAGEYPEAAESLQKSLRQLSDPIGRYFLGLTHFQLGEYELALNQFQAMLDETPDSSQARLMVAQTLFRQSRFDDSRAAAELVLAADPDNALAHDILGSVYLAQGDYDRGMAELDRAIAKAPGLVDAQLKKGVVNLALGKPDLAETPLAEAVRIAPELLNSRLLLAVSYLRRQNFGQAVATLKEGLQGRPEDAILHNHLAAAYLGQGRTDAALAELEKAKQRKPEYMAPYENLANYYLRKGQPARAMAEYQALLKVAPDNQRALLSLASLQELQGDKAGAENSLIRSVAGGGKESYLASALFYRRNDQPKKVLATLQKGLEIHPGQPALLELQGQFLLGQGQVAEALSAYRSLAEALPDRGFPLLVATLVGQGKRQEADGIARRQISLNETEPRGYLLLAAISRLQQEYSQGVEVLEGGLKKVSNELPLQMARADLFQAWGKPERALEILGVLHERHPANVPVIFNLASLHDRQGNKRQALALYRACLESDDGYLPALNNLAYLYADNYRDLEEALELAVRAFHQRPADPGIMDTLGFVMVRQGRFADALPFLEKSAGLLPDEPAVQLHLAQAYHGLGKHGQAEKALHQVIATGNPALTRPAEALLQQIRQSSGGRN